MDLTRFLPVHSTIFKLLKLFILEVSFTNSLYWRYHCASDMPLFTATVCLNRSLFKINNINLNISGNLISALRPRDFNALRKS